MGLLQIIKENKEVCWKLLCYDFQNELTPERFLNLLRPQEQQKDFAKKSSYEWFTNYIKNSDKQNLQALLQFCTGHKSVQPRGLCRKICVRFLSEDDEKASLPTSSACLNVHFLPTIHSTESKFVQSMDNALKFESQGFALAWLVKCQLISTGKYVKDWVSKWISVNICRTTVTSFITIDLW